MIETNRAFILDGLTLEELLITLRLLDELLKLVLALQQGFLNEEPVDECLIAKGLTAAIEAILEASPFGFITKLVIMFVVDQIGVHR